MRTALKLLALACLAQALIGSIAGKPIGGEELAKKLNEVSLKPMELHDLLTNEETPSKIFKTFTTEDFERFAEFDADDCTRGQMPKREEFMKGLEKAADSSLAYKNLIGFCKSLYGDMVNLCEAMKKPASK